MFNFNFKKQSKYHNEYCEIDNIRFHSRKESYRYSHLKLLEKAGEIQELELQPKFILQEGFKKDGVKYRPIIYIADFQYKEKGKVITEDVKSEITKANPVYKIKKKMLLNRYRDINFIET